MQLNVLVDYYDLFWCIYILFVFMFVLGCDIKKAAERLLRVNMRKV